MELDLDAGVERDLQALSAGLAFHCFTPSIEMTILGDMRSCLVLSTSTCALHSTYH